MPALWLRSRRIHRSTATPKFGLRLAAGTTFTLELPGGGGYYDPAERDPELVAKDVADGIVSSDGGGTRLRLEGRAGPCGPTRRTIAHAAQ